MGNPGRRQPTGVAHRKGAPLQAQGWQWVGLDFHPHWATGPPVHGAWPA